MPSSLLNTGTPPPAALRSGRGRRHWEGCKGCLKNFQCAAGSRPRPTMQNTHHARRERATTAMFRRAAYMPPLRMDQMRSQCKNGIAGQTGTGRMHAAPTDRNLQQTTHGGSARDGWRRGLRPQARFGLAPQRRFGAQPPKAALSAEMRNRRRWLLARRSRPRPTRRNTHHTAPATGGMGRISLLHPGWCTNARKMARPAGPLFSGWNCRPATLPRCTAAQTSRPPNSITAAQSCARAGKAW